MSCIDLRWSALLLFWLALSHPAYAVYKCGKTYQDTPCADAAGERVKVYEDPRTERQRWDAEILRVRQSGHPFVAKYPFIYTFMNGQWFKEGVVNGRREANIVSPSVDADVTRIHLEMRRNELDAASKKLQQSLETSARENDARLKELQRQSEEQEAKLKALRREQACRGRSSLDPVCANAK